MLKIGVTTYYFNSCNFGGTLQAYALCRYLALNNYKAEQICISSGESSVLRRLSFKRFLVPKTYINAFKKISKSFFVRYCIKDVIKRRRSAFTKFRDQIPHSAQKYNAQNIAETNSLYDVFITGSDRVWNPSWKGHPFFLGFAADKPKISYAASLTTNSLNDEENSFFQKTLANYVAVSVREKASVALLQDLSKSDVEWTLDPTMLLTQKEWDDVCADRVVPEKYIFCYFLGADRINRKVARQFAKQKGLVVVTLPYAKDAFNWSDLTFGDVRLFDVTPEQFVSLIKYAEYVFTDSFHATIFSTIYQKEYFVFERGELKGSGSRIESLVSLCRTESRYCNSPSKRKVAYLCKTPPVDYVLVSAELEEMRVKSRQFLHDALALCEKKIAERSNVNQTRHIKFLAPSRCTGCSSCSNVCPHNAITMTADGAGFLSPRFDESKCVDCGLCGRACPILNPPQLERVADPKVYACWNNDSKIRQESSSGGMFSVYAERILSQGGVVFGAAYDDSMNVVLTKVEKPEDLTRLRSSKYVQAEAGTIYRDVKTELKSGRQVLFVGTPCQVGGLYGYLGKDYPNLHTCDLVCHGVPSPVLYKKWLVYLERKLNGKIISLNMRGKQGKWSHLVVVVVDTKPDEPFVMKWKGDARAGYVGRMFQKNICLRSSCGQCPFARLPRIADITLGDFWGIGQDVPFDYPKEGGISLNLVNSEKGARLVELCKQDSTFVERSLQEALVGNRCLCTPSILNPKRDVFIQDLETSDYETLAKKYKIELQGTLTSRIRTSAYVSFVRFTRIFLSRRTIKKIKQALFGRKRA